MSEPRSGQAGENWAVAIVHGIGTPEPGQTQDAVCKAIQQVKRDFRPADQTAATDHAAGSIAHWSFGGGRAKVLETFWGDLSLVRGNIKDMIGALCMNLYGAVYVNSRQHQKASRFSRILSIAPFYLVRWIVLPLHILALCLAVPFLIWRFLWPAAVGTKTADYLTSNAELFFLNAAACVVAGLVITGWLLLRQRKQVRGQPWDVSLLFTAFAAVSALVATRPVASWFKSCVDGATTGARALHEIIVDILTGSFSPGTDACHLVITSTPIENPQLTGFGRYIALNEFAGDVAFFICAAMVLLYLLLAFGNVLRGRFETARSMFFVATISILFVVVTAMVLEVIDFITRASQFERLHDFERYWYEVGFVIWLIIVAVGAAASALWRKWALATRPSEGAVINPKSKAKLLYARLIVSEIFQFAVISATLVFILAFLGNSLILRYFEAWYHFPVPTKLLGPIFLVLLLLPVIFSDHLRLGLDIAMDVVNHFAEPHHGYPVRRSISARFHDSLDRLTKDKDRPHLLVIAHSQGSVIVVDALVAGLWSKPIGKDGEALKDRVASMTVLTFGSPLTHIYQHYFPEDYGTQATVALKGLASDGRLKWLNIYRVDDPVGTFISGPDAKFPENIDMPPGGHIDYWQVDVLGAAEVSCHLPGANA